MASKRRRNGIKRIIALGDLHCGHMAGLTPPHWQGSCVGGERATNLRREMWDRYTAIVDQLKPVHAVICNGDAIDGKGGRSGGTELIVADRSEQADMAVQCLALWEPAAGIHLTYGTPYHAGDEEDFEGLVAERLRDRGGHDAGIHDMLDLDINGCIINAKHKIGSSSIKHGRHTAAAKERDWLLDWDLREDFPHANWVLRSHVHYHRDCGSKGDRWRAMTLPALQAARTKYGGRQCSGTVDWGVVWIDVDNEGGSTWDAKIVRLKWEQRQLLKL